MKRPLVTLLAAFLLACTPTSAPPAAPEPTAPPEAEQVVQLARQDLATERGVSVEQVMLVSIEPRTWPDTGLGCPRAGELYAQVITPGYRLVLSDGTGRFTYHTDLRRVVKRCS